MMCTHDSLAFRGHRKGMRDERNLAEAAAGMRRRHIETDLDPARREDAHYTFPFAFFPCFPVSLFCTCSNPHCFGFLSGRQRRNLVP